MITDDEFRMCTPPPCTLEHDHELHKPDAAWRDGGVAEYQRIGMEDRIALLEDLLRAALEDAPLWQIAALMALGWAQ